MTNFIPLPEDDSFAKIHDHVRKKIAEMLAIPPEALTKETTRAIYEKTVQLVCQDETIQEFVAASRRADTVEATDGGTGEPAYAESELQTPRTTGADPSTENDGCGFSAPC